MMVNKNNSAELPKGWIWTTLGAICIPPQYGWTTSAVASGKLKLLRTSDITSGQINWQSIPHCQKKPDEVKKYLLEDGDIVISRAGSVGYSVLMRKPEKAIFASYLIRFRPLTNANYVAYFLKSPLYWKSISEKKLGIAVPNVNASKLKQIEFPLPPLPEQHRIVAKIEELFTKLDAGVEALKKIKAQLKRYRQAVLKHAFEGKLTEEWRKKHKDELEPASVFLEKVKEKRKKSGKYKEMAPVDISNLSELPEGWVWMKFEDIGEVNPRFSKEEIVKDIGVTFLPMRCVEELTGIMNLSIIKKLSKVMKGYTPFKNGDLLFAKITPCMENGKVAIADKLTNGIGFGSTEFHVIRLSEEVPREFFFYYMIQESFRKEAKRKMKGTAGQLRVPADYIRQVPIPCASLHEQSKIIEEIERRFSVADEIEKTINLSLQQAVRLRQSILKRAFEGKLVPQDPNDEPAEKLLARIREEKAKHSLSKKIAKKRR